MQIAADGSLIVSPTDLVGYLACDHLATLELQALHGELEKPFRTDPELDLIRRRGFEHEAAYLQRLRTDGRIVHEIATRDARTPDELRAAEAETLEAMRAGADVIFQATFFDGRWRGHADFLLRVERPSALGSWSYDVADTKLARRVKAAAILQMCVYADLLERLQGVPPDTLSVVTGDGVAHPHLLSDYAAYYRAAKERFEAAVFEGAERGPTYPNPVEHCRVCTWWPVCIDRRRADDHLSLVAGMNRSATRKLALAGLPTLTALGRSPADVRVKDLGQRSLERLRNQARLQADYAETRELRYELIPPEDANSGRGLAALPEPSPQDLFFDIESDPWALEGGLEYLFGTVEEVGGEPRYDALWAHDREDEKRIFETFIDRVAAALERDPAMHVYHYAAYEPAALRRLMGRHATREDELDRFLRAGVFVDLFQVVRQGLRASLESYSIKQVEKFYMPEREGPVTSAGFSVVEYERWMEAREQEVLDAIEAYNRDDCVSTWRLRNWLEGLRLEAAPLYGGEPPPRPTIQDGEPTQELARAQAETRQREDGLRAGVPADRAERTPEQQGRWLLAGLLDWHRREAKPQWWDHFRLLGASVEDLIADGTALAGLTFDEDLGRIARSSLQRYRFDPSQETKLREGESAVDAATGEAAGTIVRLDPLAGVVELKRNPSRPHPRALIPAMPYGTEPMRSALGRLADAVLAGGIEGDSPYTAARDLILRNRPRIEGIEPGAPLASSAETPTLAARRLVLELDHSVLPIQGPPGTGKTYTGARMILDLVATGKRVGVTAQSHRVIGNLLEAVAQAAAAEGVPVRIGQRCDESDETSNDGRIERLDTNELTRSGLASRTLDVVGGTSWLWAREEMECAVDVLFVDEAGQLSLAAVCSVAAAADSIVLLGDPNQLPQVSQGSHPEGAAASALEHLVGDNTTIAPDRGLLLGTTFRLHPDVNGYISDAFYAGRLEPDPANVRQVVGPGPVLEGTGVRLLPVLHSGNGNRSREESGAIVNAVAALLGRTWTDRRGVARPMSVDDVLVVAPYNAQVAEIGRALEASLGFRGRVGTVDKFQGQEAAVAIYSMATSTPEEAPRDLEFLYSANRLNVAMSRARSLAVLVCNPALLQVACRTPEQMRLLNKFWRLVEIATTQATRAGEDLPDLPVGPMEPASEGPLVLWADLEPV